MLKSIDILIGLSVVMLVASMAVTVMTGFVTQVRNTRGKNLQQGLADLLKMINPQFGDTVALSIAEGVLIHPLIRDKAGRMGTVVYREELTKLLLELASGTGPQRLADGLRAQLAATLTDHGIANPGQTLENIQTVALQLEKTNPELSNMARANLAILHEAQSSFVAKVNVWFDQTMDRVSHRFTASTRVITLFCGLLLACAFQLDSIALVNRISVDDELRASLTQQANSIAARANPDQPAANPDLYAAIIDQGIIAIPHYPADLARFGDLRHLAGILFTTLLLSLGAPFWYSALQQLLQLRSKIAQDDEQQRQQRQSTQAVVATPVGPAAVAPGVVGGDGNAGNAG
jgi:hypothetical protein